MEKEKDFDFNEIGKTTDNDRGIDDIITQFNEKAMSFARNGDTENAIRNFRGAINLAITCDRGQKSLLPYANFIGQNKDKIDLEEDWQRINDYSSKIIERTNIRIKQADERLMAAKEEAENLCKKIFEKVDELEKNDLIEAHELHHDALELIFNYNLEPSYVSHFKDFYERNKENQQLASSLNKDLKRVEAFESLRTDDKEHMDDIERR